MRYLEQIEAASVLTNKYELAGCLSRANLRLSCEGDHLGNLVPDAHTLLLLKAQVDVPLKEVALVAACKESVAFFGDAERHLTLCVEVHDETKVMGRQDIKRLVSAVNTHMLAIDHGKKATCLVKVMHSVHFFESCRGVQTFGDLAKPLSVHASLVILLEKLSRGLELSLNELLAPVQLLRVENDLVLLVYHLALQLADLALKELHFLGPGESLAGHCRAVYRSSSINHARISTVHID